jgi:hypothetical protein
MADSCRAVDEFLSKQPPWLQRMLQLKFDPPPSSPDWLQKWLEAKDVYEQLLIKCPDRMKKYRSDYKREYGSTLASQLPHLPKGARPKDDRARKIQHLRNQGKTQKQIAEILNIENPNLLDAKGNKRPATSEVVRKALSSRNEKTDRK